MLAQASLPAILVNAVVRPETVENLPEVIRYFSNLGLKQIYLNIDYSASWGPDDVNKIQAIYDEVGKLYMDFYLQGKPHFISLIDSKITVILRQGYRPLERCRMGTGEFAFSPNGNVYPCERLIGDDSGNGHCIGNISAPETIKRNPCHLKEGPKVNDECLSCSLSEYCMNWCGCSNFFATGFYNRVSPFICASERAAILTSFRVMQLLEEKMGPVFFEHLAGRPQSKSRLN